MTAHEPGRAEDLVAEVLAANARYNGVAGQPVDDDPFESIPPAAAEQARVDDAVALLTAAADRLERLVADATPGPWELERQESITGPTACIMVPLPPHPGARTGLTRLAKVGTQDAADADLIVALVNAGPALVAWLREAARWAVEVGPDRFAVAVARKVMEEQR